MHMTYDASNLLALICEKQKAKRSFMFEHIDEAQLIELTQQEFNSSLSNHSMQSNEYEFSRQEFADVWPIKHTQALSLFTCKDNSNQVGMAFITAQMDDGKARFFKSQMTLNQLITLLLNTNEQSFDARLCQNLFSNDSQKMLNESNAYGFHCNLESDIEEFMSASTKFQNPQNMLELQRKHFSKGQLASIDGYHFFVSHADRAKDVMSSMNQRGLGNVVGFIFPDAEQTSRFSGISVITDKNYICLYSKSLTDINGKPLPPKWKIFDIFVLSVCQVINKYSRIAQHVDQRLEGKIPRKAIEIAIEDEQTGLAFA